MLDQLQMPDSKYWKKGINIILHYCHGHFHSEDLISNNVSVLCMQPPCILQTSKKHVCWVVEELQGELEI